MRVMVSPIVIAAFKKKMDGIRNQSNYRDYADSSIVEIS